MRYFNDLISGKIDRYLENCKSRFTKKYDDDKLKAIWLHLKEENYINNLAEDLNHSELKEILVKLGKSVFNDNKRENKKK